MVFFSPNIGVVMTSVLSLVPLLRPFIWQSILLLVLPSFREVDLALLEAHVQFLLGMQVNPKAPCFVLAFIFVYGSGCPAFCLMMHHWYSHMGILYLSGLCTLILGLGCSLTVLVGLRQVVLLTLVCLLLSSTYLLLDLSTKDTSDQSDPISGRKAERFGPTCLFEGGGRMLFPLFLLVS